MSHRYRASEIAQQPGSSEATVDRVCCPRRPRWLQSSTGQTAPAGLAQHSSPLAAHHRLHQTTSTQARVYSHWPPTATTLIELLGQAGPERTAKQRFSISRSTAAPFLTRLITCSGHDRGDGAHRRGTEVHRTARVRSCVMRLCDDLTALVSCSVGIRRCCREPLATSIGLRSGTLVCCRRGSTACCTRSGRVRASVGEPWSGWV